ncbi:MAG: arginine-tRNA-protein transferase [Candidatus Azotimanducaceae bacterium]|jgi:arginine-tRNA-protein transferase
MIRHTVAEASELRYFTTPEHECSYLENKLATTLFADPEAIIGTDLYTALSAVGFRRSGKHIYRPHCQNCSACIPIRVPADLFSKTRKQKRVWRKNQDFEVKVVPPTYQEEYFSLYEEYIAARHSDGDMYPADPTQFRSFLIEGRSEAVFVEFRCSGKLIAIAVVDILNDGISAIYTFFDPAESKRSPGTYAVLWIIEETLALGKPYVYLGYWIKDSQKMNYKTDYRPVEMYLQDQWRLVK